MFQAGQQFGTYTLIKQLGKGAYGEVWMAMRQAKFVTTRVALKLPATEKVDFEAIRQEAILWEQASGHPNVLPIIEADEYDGQVVIVSEYASDGSLDDLLQEKHHLPVRKAVEMALGIAQGLEFLHERRIIHRDIKPANILLQSENPRLTDFGMSRIVLSNRISTQISGTPYYMAPEAFSRKRSKQTDIWSLGVVLFEMLTGRMPFPGEDVSEIYDAILNRLPLPLPDQIPLSVQKIVFKALTKNPAERYQTAAEMRQDLLQCLSGLTASARLNENFEIEKTAESANQRDTAQNTRFKKTHVFSEPVQPKKKSAPKKISAPFKYLAPALVLLTLAAVIGGFYFLNRPSLVPLLSGGKFGYGNADKNLVCEAKYDLARPFSDGLALVAVGQKQPNGIFEGKYGFIDQTCREAIALNYEDAKSFAENLAAVKFQGKWGFVDKNGHPATPFNYEAAESFSDGRAAVRLDGQIGFIDPSGATVIAHQFREAESFKDGRARVMRADGTEFYIDRQGAEFIR